MVVCEYSTLTAGWLTCLPFTSSSHDWGKQVHAFGLCGSPFEASCHASQKLVVGAHLYASSFSLFFRTFAFSSCCSLVPTHLPVYEFIFLLIPAGFYFELLPSQRFVHRQHGRWQCVSLRVLEQLWVQFCAPWQAHHSVSD